MRKLFILWVLLLLTGACSTQRKLSTVQREQIGASLRLPSEREAPPPAQVAGIPRRDTLRVTDLEGREMIIMQAIRDEETGEMVATEQLQAAVVTARFRNVAERHGRIDLEFQVIVPEEMQDSRWQLRLHPDLYLLQDSLRLEDVVITGTDYRKAQLRGYQQYEKFLGRIVTDSMAFVDLRNLEIFLERNIPQVYALKNDTTFVSDEVFASYFGVSEQEAVEHYTNKFLRRRNEWRKMNRERMFRKYVKAPLMTDGIRLDTVLHSPDGTFIYNYIQTITTRPKLRKAEIRLCGEIFEQDRQLYTVPRSDALTFYISSVSAFVDGTERYKTVILSRNLETNTASNIDFRTGRFDIDEKLGNNAREIAFIKENLRNLLLNETYELDSVTIAASASPEGTVAANNQLTYKRSRSAAAYFDSYIHFVRDSVRREDGAIISVSEDGWDEQVHASKRASQTIRFLSRSGGENWLGLDDFVRVDSVMTEDQKAVYFRLAEVPDADEREKRMRSESWYKYLTERYYPRLRTVRFTFALHRKGMIKDTVHTTELDSAYMRGVEAIRDHEYETALALLTPYQDFNTAVAYVALDRNASAMAILSRLPRTAPVNYMLALLYARQNDDQNAVQHYLDACGQDRSYVSRGNLDPEISALIRKYDLNNDNSDDLWKTDTLSLSSS